MRVVLPRRHPAVLAVASLLALALSLSFVSSAWAASPSVSHVTLLNRVDFTTTGITLNKGDAVTIAASGQIHFGGGRIAHMTPPGIAWGPECQAIALKQPRSNPWPAPGLSCWSLIARVGAGKPIEIGSAASFHAAQAGLLRLGLNDNFVDDNTGQWVATVSVTAATLPTTRGALPPASKKSSSTAIFVLIAVLVLVALLLLLLFARRRRRAAASGAIDGSMVPEPALAAAGTAAGLAPLLADLDTAVPSAPPQPFAAPETDSIDVNIFEVEFSNGLTLRVGYNHFPDGTELHWKVTQSRVEAASGVFITQGGGSTNHVETVPLGTKLAGRDSQPDGADVQFDWAINGVPFRYSVRRDPNC
jgi:hypothetical protein